MIDNQTFSNSLTEKDKELYKLVKTELITGATKQELLQKFNIDENRFDIVLSDISKLYPIKTDGEIYKLIDIANISEVAKEFFKYYLMQNFIDNNVENLYKIIEQWQKENNITLKELYEKYIGEIKWKKKKEYL